MEQKRQELLAEIKEIERCFGRRYLNRAISKDTARYWNLKASLASVELKIKEEDGD